MAKRFVDTDIWKDPWFQELAPINKCLWKYLCDNCDNAGVWKINKSLAQFQIGGKIDWISIPKIFGSRLYAINQEKWLLVQFIDFQYGTLSESCNPHKKVFELLEKHDLRYPLGTLPKTSQVPYQDRVQEEEEEEEEDKEEDKEEEKEEEKTWRNTFDVYLVLVNQAYEKIVYDQELISQQEELNPNVDVRLSLKKAVVNFWGKEAGWKHKKKSKTKDIDMVQTLINAISLNKVQKQKQYGPQKISNEEIKDNVFSMMDKLDD